MIRRQPPQPTFKMIFTKSQDSRMPPPENQRYNQVHDESQEEDDEDLSRYSLRPNLSLFNISADNLNYQTEDDVDDESRHPYWLDEILHSTKIDEH